jgi:hypothetical protein
MKERKLITIKSGEFVVMRLSVVSIADAKFLGSQISEWFRCGSGCDTIADKRAWNAVKREY